MPGQHELIPHVDEIIPSNETTDVVFVSFTENLLIDPRSLLSIRKVVSARRSTPTDVRRQLHYPADLFEVSVVEIVGQGRHLSNGSGQSFHDELTIPFVHPFFGSMWHRWWSWR